MPRVVAQAFDCRLSTSLFRIGPFRLSQVPAETHLLDAVGVVSKKYRGAQDGIKRPSHGETLASSRGADADLLLLFWLPASVACGQTDRQTDRQTERTTSSCRSHPLGFQRRFTSCRFHSFLVGASGARSPDYRPFRFNRRCRVLAREHLPNTCS
jgi:hypothetical protein